MTILNLKETINQQLSFPVEQQKLIYRGRILEDDKTISDYQISQGDPLVLMTNKKSTQQAALNKLVSMGFEKEQAEEALQSANNNFDRALEVLSGKQTGTFDFLKDNPQFQEIVSVIQQNPEEFENFLNQLETVNPELYTLIMDNQEEFLQLIKGDEEEATRLELTQQEEKDVKDLTNLASLCNKLSKLTFAATKTKNLQPTTCFPACLN
eukprot:CAMPEP_0202425854 /NCGR_PEP_ID=MMETSP1345-20130828/367_1 /ASSEMBLY_ACC=CAM_ASM_000843 /TAXON_ID=342563 /ORGANISM="Fabrea Fabrea salina" /LENGTH=209 /DNA_ID=CAMNT_0049036145 /DNA_START=14 /DNA_END=641 /DNA_ORIENTATION=-